jgi:hypothetical protein
MEAYSCETSRLRNFLDNWLTVGGEVVILTGWQHFTARKIPGNNYYEGLSRIQDHSAAGKIR